MWRGRKLGIGDREVIPQMHTGCCLGEERSQSKQLNYKLTRNKETFQAVTESPHGDPGKDYTDDPHLEYYKVTEDKDRIYGLVSATVIELEDHTRRSSLCATQIG